MDPGLQERITAATMDSVYNNTKQVWKLLTCPNRKIRYVCQVEHPVPKAHNNSNHEFKSFFQVWRKSGETCPEGTVAIRRTTEQDILRAGSVRKFRREVIRYQSVGDDVEWAMAYLDGGKYKGAAADVNVWAPRVSDNQEFSAAQIYVGAATNDQDANTLQAGWIAAPSLFGDSWPRLFSYWTTDASRSTGCFNLFCPGYIHTSPSVAIGARITTLSTYGGVQHDGYYEIRQKSNDGPEREACATPGKDLGALNSLVPKNRPHKVRRLKRALLYPRGRSGQSDMDNERWVLRFPSANNEIGYWPMSLFTHLNKAPATKLEYGGTVRNKKTNGVHTGTQMGSGHFAEEGFGKAAHISNIKMADDSNFGIPYSAGLLQTSAKSSNCYNVQFTPNDKRWGSYIYYGGPGKNNNCP
nr:uncharacterized protein LOC109172166 [Ipomoea batatas]